MFFDSALEAAAFVNPPFGIFTPLVFRITEVTGPKNESDPRS